PLGHLSVLPTYLLLRRMSGTPVSVLHTRFGSDITRQKPHESAPTLARRARGPRVSHLQPLGHLSVSCAPSAQEARIVPQPNVAVSPGSVGRGMLLYAAWMGCDAAPSNG